MIDHDDMNRIIDQYALKFIDEYAVAFGELPSENIRRIWMAGFIDGCDAVSQALRMK